MLKTLCTQTGIEQLGTLLADDVKFLIIVVEGYKQREVRIIQVIMDLSWKHQYKLCLTQCNSFMCVYVWLHI